MLAHDINKEDRTIQEFANLGPSNHNFGVDVNIHFMQPDRNVTYEPRIKVYLDSWIKGPCFTITLSNSPRVIGDYRKTVTKTDLNKLVFSVKRCRKAILSFWNDPGMTVGELTRKLQGDIMKSELLDELEQILSKYADDTNYYTSTRSCEWVSNGVREEKFHQFIGTSKPAKRALKIIKELKKEN